MSTLLIFTALFGAALLGFLTAFYLSGEKLTGLKDLNRQLEEKNKGCQQSLAQVAAENEALKLSFTNQQGLFQSFENEQVNLREALRNEQSKVDSLLHQIAELEVRSNEKVREIEVVREVPVIIFRDKQRLLNKEAKAEVLLKAFQKGASQEEKVLK
jgi:hypothetical protein